MNPETQQPIEEQELATEDEQLVNDVKEPTVLERSDNRSRSKLCQTMKSLQLRHQNGEIDDERYSSAISQLDSVCQEEFGKELREFSEYVSDREIINFVKEKSPGTPEHLRHEFYEMLAGLTGKDAHSIRQQMWQEDYNSASREAPKSGQCILILRSLAGVDTPEAWQMRQEIEPLLRDDRKYQILYSLAGLDTPEAWAIRDAWRNQMRECFEPFLISLIGIDTPQAWKDREAIFASRVVAQELEKNQLLLESLAGLDSEQAPAFRKKVYKRNDQYGQLDFNYFLGMAWLKTEEVNQAITQNKDNPKVILALAGQETKEAWQLRYRHHTDYHDQAESIAGMQSEKARELRVKIATRGSVYDIARSLTGRIYTNPRVLFHNCPDVFFNEE